jgi:hypothetical protein
MSGCVRIPAIAVQQIPHGSGWTGPGRGGHTEQAPGATYAASSGDDTKGRSLKTEERGPTSLAGTGVRGRRAPLDVVAADHLPVCDERRITSVQLGSVRSEWTGMTP